MPTIILRGRKIPGRTKVLGFDPLELPVRHGRATPHVRLRPAAAAAELRDVGQCGFIAYLDREIREQLARQRRLLLIHGVAGRQVQGAAPGVREMPVLRSAADLGQPAARRPHQAPVEVSPPRARRKQPASSLRPVQHRETRLGRDRLARPLNYAQLEGR